MSDATFPPPSPQPRPRKEAAPWPGLFRQSDEPIFLLDRRKRLRFVNPAWEKLTGLSAADAYGMACTRHKSSPAPDPDKALALALRPPPEVLAGRAQRVRRAAPGAGTGPPWWDVSFFPIADADGVLAVLGKIGVVGGEKKIVPRAEKLPEGLAALRARKAEEFPFDLLAGGGAPAQRLLAQARAASASRAPVWVVGGPGSGKETLARVLHHQGPDREKTFAAVDCAGLPPMVVRGMLFGAGGLTALGQVGTLYLREPAALTGELQAELLAWLGERESETPRVIAGSAAPPADDARAGRLAEGFLAELAVVEIVLPALRERPEDLPRLAYRLLERAGAAGGLAPDALEVLRQYDWPGNVRQLAAVLAEAARAAGGGRVGAEHLPRWLREAARASREPPAVARESFLNLDLILEQVERRLILLALKQSKGNRTEAARRLGIWRPRLLRRIEALKLDEGGRQPAE